MNAAEEILMSATSGALQVGVGKMFVRMLSHDAAIAGVIQVPEWLTPEQLYPANLADDTGLIVVNLPRDPSDGYKYGPIDNLLQLEANDLLRMPIFQQFGNPNMFDLFIRETEIPPSTPGLKWVIAVGASRAHSGVSRMIEFNHGKISVTPGEKVGEPINAILREPIWGPQDIKYSLSTTMHYAALDEVVKESRARNNDEDFHAYLRIMEELMPSKTFYTLEEYERHSAFSQEAIARVMLEKDSDSKPAATRPSM